MPQYVNEKNQVACWTVTSPEENAPWMVLIHGLGVDHEIWDFIVPTLRPSHSLLMIDLPDHGGNTTPFTVEEAVKELLVVMDGQSIDKAVILGHCIGGIVAQVFAKTYPERCSKLILLDTFPLSREGIDYASFRSLNKMSPAVKYLPVPLFSNVLSSIFAATAHGEALLYLRISQQKPSSVYRAFKESMQYLRTSRARTMPFPIHYLVGSRDHLDPIIPWNRKAAKIGDGHFESIKHCGHFPMVDNPELVAELIKKTAKN